MLESPNGQVVKKKVLAIITIRALEDGGMDFQGSCLDNRDKTITVLAEAMRNYVVGKIWEKVKDKILIRPPSSGEAKKFS